MERGRDFPALNQKHQTARCDITLNSPSFDAIPRMDGFNALTIRNKQNSLRPAFYRDASRSFAGGTLFIPLTPSAREKYFEPNYNRCLSARRLRRNSQPGISVSVHTFG